MTDISLANISLANLAIIATALERIATTLERIDEKLGESINEYGQISVIADTTTKLADESEVGVWLNKNTAKTIKEAASSISAAIEELPTQRAEWEP